MSGDILMGYCDLWHVYGFEFISLFMSCILDGCVNLVVYTMMIVFWCMQVYSACAHYCDKFEPTPEQVYPYSFRTISESSSGTLPVLR